jgi:DNA-directed RNA polymerase subunit L
LELILVSKDKKSVVIEFIDSKETIVHPLIDRLLSDKDVVLATYKTGHPQLDKPRLTVKTQKVSPESAVKKAADNLAEEIKTLKKEFEKAVKSPKAKKAKAAKPKDKKATKPKVSKAKKEAKKPKPKTKKTTTKKAKPKSQPAKKKTKTTKGKSTKKKSK